MCGPDSQSYPTISVIEPSVYRGRSRERTMEYRPLQFLFLLNWSPCIKQQGKRINCNFQLDKATESARILPFLPILLDLDSTGFLTRHWVRAVSEDPTEKKMLIDSDDSCIDWTMIWNLQNTYSVMAKIFSVKLNLL